MSLFSENTWEENTVGDKLSEEIFRKNKNHDKGKKSKKTKPGKSTLNKVKKKTATSDSKIISEETKNGIRKIQKAILKAAVSEEYSPKKLKKGEEKVSNDTSTSVEKKLKLQKFPKQEISAQETKSQRKRKKAKLKKMAAKGQIISMDDNAVTENKKSPMKKINIQRLKAILQSKEKTKDQKISKEPLSLRERMMSQLRASRFRFLNETLYNNDSSESKKYFKEDPDAFTAYHVGYKQQVQQWPVNPLDVIITSVSKMAKDLVVADFGCGEARLADSVPQKVHSFDLVAINDKVKACDMAHTPLLTAGANVVVFCLSLMGTNLADYLLEANRVLKMNGILKIADIESRFENVDDFIKLLKSYGFINTWKDLSHNLFYFMDFKKISDVNRSMKKLPSIVLKPCLYKKR